MAVDINPELYTIKNSRYGSEMRQAIYDALDKVSKSSGGGSGIVLTYGSIVPMLLGQQGLYGETEEEDGV